MLIEKVFAFEDVQKAWNFALIKHKGQKMKSPPNAPYSFHIIKVTKMAVTYASKIDDCDINLDLCFLACCALLHDTIEDTNTTYEEIEQMFGKPVADGVLALSKNKLIPKQIRIADSVERIKTQPREVAIVKLADRFCNMERPIPDWSREKRKLYKQDATLIADELGDACEPLKCDLQNRIDNYQLDGLIQPTAIEKN